RLQARPLHAYAVHARAVLAAEVLDEQAVRAERDAGMTAGHASHAEDDLVAGDAAEAALAGRDAIGGNDPAAVAGQPIVRARVVHHASRWRKAAHLILPPNAGRRRHGATALQAVCHRRKGAETPRSRDGGRLSTAHRPATGRPARPVAGRFSPRNR